ncbi:MAG: hypothetical protein ACLGHN_13855 [Bacteriovoracia bacterium]
MKRRSFLLSVFAFGLSAELEPLKAAIPKSQDCIYMKSNQAYQVKSGQELVLPEQPKHGDSLSIIVDRNSLVSPSKIISQDSKILGSKEPLELDQMAIFKLVYNKNTNNWLIG